MPFVEMCFTMAGEADQAWRTRRTRRRQNPVRQNQFEVVNVYSG